MVLLCYRCDEVLTDSPRSRKYWNALKTKLENEGSVDSPLHQSLQCRFECQQVQRWGIAVISLLFSSTLTCLSTMRFFSLCADHVNNALIAHIMVSIHGFTYFILI